MIEAGYTVHRYRPRIEGLFARIERWVRHSAGDVHWRSISRDNVLTIYGKDANSRIAAPNDPRRIFSWLICKTRDDRGPAVLYEYEPEDGRGVDITRAHERNKGDPSGGCCWTRGRNGRRDSVLTGGVYAEYPGAHVRRRFEVTEVGLASYLRTVSYAGGRTHGAAGRTIASRVPCGQSTVLRKRQKGP